MISIIVPVFNVELHLIDQCISSLLAQTCQAFEILVIDDGSRESCARYCDALCRRDDRIRVFHKPNAGVSSARNVGLEHAKGEYIAFVDADDWVEATYLEVLQNSMTSTGADMSVIGYVCDYEDREKNPQSAQPQTHDIQQLDQAQIWRELLLSPKIGGYLCNKLYRRDKIREGFDQRLHYCEDFVFTSAYCTELQKAVFVDEKLYHYRQGAGNASSNFTFNKRIMTLLDAYDIIEGIYSIHAPDYLDMLKHNALKNALNLRARYLYANVQDPQAYARIQEVIERHMPEVLRSSGVGLHRKANVMLTWLFPVTVFKLKNRILRRKI